MRGISEQTIMLTVLGLIDVVMWQVVVHMAFVVSALLLAWTDRISTKTAAESRTAH